MTTQTPAPAAGHYAPVNGLNLYYETHGHGGPAPLVLLHGGLGAIEMFGPVLGALAAGRQVIGVDLQAHGRTADVDRPLSYAALADDVAALIRHLGLAQADVLGYSLGGGVALQTALRHPAVVRKLVLVSTPYARQGWHAENLAGMNQMSAAAAPFLAQTPMYHQYAALAPRVDDWPVLLDKLGNLMRADYDWSADLAGLQAPTLLVVGDYDSVRTAHAVSFFEHLGGGQKDAGWDGAGMTPARLAILPGHTHYNIFTSPALAGTAAAFLDA